MKLQKKVFAFFIAVLMATVACSTFSNGSTEESPSPSKEPPKQSTATRTAAAAEDASTGFVTFENEVFSIKYPADWYHEGMAGLGFFSTDPELQSSWISEEGGSPNVEQGAILIVLAGTGAEMGLAPGVSLLDAFNATIALEAGECEVLEDVKETTINDMPAVLAVWSCSNPAGISTTIIGAMISDGEHSAGLTGITASDSTDQYLPILKEMINSFRFTG